MAKPQALLVLRPPGRAAKGAGVPATSGRHPAMTPSRAFENALDTGATGPSRAALDTSLRQVLIEVLGLDSERVAEFDRDTGLFGHLPELDSMAVATLFTEIEDRIGITIDDDEVDGEMLETYGALLAFVEGKAILG